MHGNEQWVTHEIKRRVILRSGGICYHCKKKAAKAAVDARGLPALYDEKGRRFHIDHLKPLCIGGENKEENLVISCPDCNQKKQRQNLRHKEEIDKFLEMVNSRAKKE